jgi:hypothetical protein
MRKFDERTFFAILSDVQRSQKESSMQNQIIGRIQSLLGCSDLLETLVEKCKLSDLQSLLLEVYRQKTKKLTAKQVFEQYKHNRFVKHAKTEIKKMMAFDSLAFSLLPSNFEILELSPLAPLGSCSVIASVDQNNILSTIRNTEVCSDPTNVLAFESSLRRQQLHDKTPRIRLCTSQKVVRCQDFKMPHCFPNFRLFCLTSAGKDEGSFKFELEELYEHLSYFATLSKKSKDLSIEIKDLEILVTALDESRKDALKSQVLDKLSKHHPSVKIQFHPERTAGRNYYRNACFHIFGKTSSGENLMLVDGGFTNWTQIILNNSKERFLISGFGSERFLACFSPQHSD